MKVYATYEFYQKQGGTMDETSFERAALRASAYIRGVTLGRSDSYDGDELKYATCEIADIYNALFNGSQKNEIKSENNDGYSVTFISETTDGESKEELYQRKSYAVIRTWLLTTGLLNRRVGCRCGGGCCDHEC